MYTYSFNDGRLVSNGDTEGSLGGLLNAEIDNYMAQYEPSDDYLNMVNVVFNVFDGIDMYEVDTFMFEEAKYEDSSMPVIDGGNIDVSGDDGELEVVDLEDNVAIVFQEYEERVRKQQEELESIRVKVRDCDEAKRKLSSLNEEIRRIQEHVRSFKGIVEDEFFVQNIADYVGEIVEEANKLKKRIIELETGQQAVQLQPVPKETPRRRSSVNMDFMTPQVPQRRMIPDEYKEAMLIPETPELVSAQLEPILQEAVLLKMSKDIHPAVRNGAKWWGGPYEELLGLNVQLNEGNISEDEFRMSYGVLRQRILDSRDELEVKVAEILIDTLQIFVDYIRENGVNDQTTQLYLVQLQEYIEFVMGMIEAENKDKEFNKLSRSLDTLKSHLGNLSSVEDMNEELIRLDDLIRSIESQIRTLVSKGLVIGPSIVDSVYIMDNVYGYK